MNRWQSLLRVVLKLLRPPVWLAVVLTLLSCAGLIAAFTGATADWLSYCAYALSAYTLCADLVLTWKLWPRLVRGVRTNPLLQGYRKDLDSRAIYSVHISLIINIAYALFKGWAGIWYHSVWFGTLAGYYIIVALARSSLARSMRQEEAPAKLWQRYCQTGWLLLILSLTLAVMGTMMIFRRDRISYPGFIIYVVALYTFYAVINAVRNLLRYRKLEHPVYVASKAISLATAFVSLFSMQTAMLAQFGDGDEFFYRLMSSLTGGGVFFLIHGMAIYMILHGRKEKKLAQD